MEMRSAIEQRAFKQLASEGVKEQIQEAMLEDFLLYLELHLLIKRLVFFDQIFFAQ